jgi:hypothetical protein
MPPVPGGLEPLSAFRFPTSAFPSTLPINSLRGKKPSQTRHTPSPHPSQKPLETKDVHQFLPRKQVCGQRGRDGAPCPAEARSEGGCAVRLRARSCLLRASESGCPFHFVPPASERGRGHRNAMSLPLIGYGRRFRRRPTHDNCQPTNRRCPIAGHPTGDRRVRVT